MVLPENYLVSSYKSAMCAAWKCYLRVSGLFLFIPLSLESLSFASQTLALNSASPLLDVARLPRASALPASPRARTSVPVSSAFILGSPSPDNSMTRRNVSVDGHVPGCLASIDQRNVRMCARYIFPTTSIPDRSTCQQILTGLTG